MLRASAWLKTLGWVSLVLSLCGGLWMVEALNTFSALWLVACVLVPTILLVMRAIGLVLASREAERAEPAVTADDAWAAHRLGRRCAWTFLAGLAAIVVAANLLAQLRHADWTLAAIAVLIGVILLPLGRALEFSAFYFTGAGDIVFSAGIAAAARRHITVADPLFGLIPGLALWLTVVLVLLLGRRMTARLARP